jgi:serine/threonine-protein kinase
MSLKKIDRYEIISEIGRGGMATVYRAHDPSFERDVAIKVLPREFLHDTTFRARFEREAKTIGTLEHPAIVPVYDFGEEDGQPYLVMRYMAGGSLSDLIQKGPMSLDEVIRIVTPIASALDEAHLKGIIHRDVKPANVLFDQRGDPYLSDFGIVKVSEATAQLTGAGAVGTPAYMAPELGSRGGLTPLVDIYALGVTVYQMLTGELPYHADTPMGVLMAHMRHPIPDIRKNRSDLPVDVQRVMEGVLAKEPSDRYHSAVDFANDLIAAAALVTDEGTIDMASEAAISKPPLMKPARPVTPPEQMIKDVIDESAPAPDAPGTVPVPPTPPPQIPESSRPAAVMPDSDAAVPVLGAEPRGRNIPIWAWIGGGILGLVLCAGACIALLMVTGNLGGEDDSVSLTLHNRSTEAICRVYISPTAGEESLSNRLGSDTIPAGDSYTFDLEPGEYDLRADSCSNIILDMQAGWQIIENRDWMVTGIVPAPEDAEEEGEIVDQGEIRCGQTLSAQINEGDEHVWAFTGSGGDIVTIAMNETDGMDTYLTLYDSDVNELEHDDDSGDSLNALIENYELPSDGIYVIVARGFGHQGGSYELSLACGSTTPSTSSGTSLGTGDGFYCDEVWDAGQIDCGDSFTGTVADGYEHQYTFYGTVGQSVTIGMNRVEDIDPYLRLIAPNGEEEIHNDDGAGYPDSLIEDHILEETGMYIIVAHDFFSCEGGDYELIFTCE